MFKTNVSIDNQLPYSFTVTNAVTPSLSNDYWQNDPSATVGQSGTTEILWLSRDDGITDGDAWVFTTGLTIDGVYVQLMEQVTGTFWSSTMALQITAGTQNSGWVSGPVSVSFIGGHGGLYRVTATLSGDDVTYTVAQVVAQAILPQIQHVVVLMFENRSFDNLLGWLAADSDYTPAQYLPNRPPFAYDGLKLDTYSNCDPSVNGGHAVFAVRGTADASYSTPEYFVPSPDPGEEFDHVTTQIFNGGETADMSGFLADYVGQVTKHCQPAGDAVQIMHGYGPDQLPVISQLAKSFAVSDAWFASMPTQTWPNRGFLQTGCSDGRSNNDFFLPWDITTIFDVCSAQNIGWMVYNDGGPAMTQAMFPFKYLCNDTNFGSIEDFAAACAQPAEAANTVKLPPFTFLEPHFGVIVHANDESYHPPNDVRPAEQFLARIYDILRGCAYRDQILFLVLFDEHGGTYDHVPPPSGAVAPLPHPVTIDGTDFGYDRFGVRVPAIAISSYIRTGTVFRSDTAVPLDHTSVLATLRDWLGLQPGFEQMLPSPRIAAAPNLHFLLTETTPQDWPALTPAVQLQAQAVQAIPLPGDDVALNDIQRIQLVAAAEQAQKRPFSPAERQAAFAKLGTHGDARSWMASIRTGNK